MGRPRKRIGFNAEHVVVELVRFGRGEAAVNELKRRFDKAPFLQRQLLRERLARAVHLFAEARERNDRLGIWKR